jgi:hypothetical protein
MNRGCFSVAVLILLVSTSRAQFHSVGVANCDGCHSMHASEDGASLDPLAPIGWAYLLKFGNATDTCLECHATDHGSILAPDPLLPPPELGAGNFTFLFEDNLNDARDGATNPIGGNHAGHNVSSLRHGIPLEPLALVAPGGSYASSELSCTSCHDPHGNENYRHLYGANEEVAGGYVFLYDAPVGDGLPLAGGSESPSSHTAYRSGWSQWCANCHGMYHDGGLADFEHPVDETLGSDHGEAYNQYAGGGNPTGGDFATAYLPEVALEDGAASAASSDGATAVSRISCMSCHRAHASSGPSIGRWDFNVRYLNEDGAASGSYPLPNPYPGPDQRQLCVKCHYPDVMSHGQGQACIECHAGSGPGDPPVVPPVPSG